MGQYTERLSAGVVSKRLTDEGVANRVWVPPRSDGECYIWVPPEAAERARRILEQPAVSEDELTALALQDSPPDDFESGAGRATPLFAQVSGSHTPLLIVLAVVGLLGAFLLYARKPPSHEIDRQHSPNGRADAVLIDVPKDAAGGHSYEVCLQRAGHPQPAGPNCGEVAYLGGVGGDGVSQAVTLIWKSSSELEIRYASATSVHIYQSVVVWGSGRRTGAPIFIRAVRNGDAVGQAPR